MVSSRTTRGHLIFVKSREIRHDSMITIHKPNIGIVFEAKFRQKDPGQSRASNSSTNTQGSGFCEFEGDLPFYSCWLQTISVQLDTF